MEKKVTKKPARKTAKPAKTTKKVIKAVSKKTKPAVTKKTTTKKAPKVDAMDVFAQSRLVIFAQSSGVTVVSALIFAATGYYLDKAMGTEPLMLTVCLVLGYPVTLGLLYFKFRRFAKDKLKAVKN